MNKLSDLRKNIDSIDNSIIDLLAERMKVVEKIGQYKKENNIPALDKARWEEVLSSKLKLSKDKGLSESLVEKIYNQIHEHALKLEEF